MAIQSKRFTRIEFAVPEQIVDAIIPLAHRLVLGQPPPEPLCQQAKRDRLLACDSAVFQDIFGEIDYPLARG